MMHSGVDLLIRGSNVYDGSGDDGFAADVGITGDRIACIVKAPEGYKGRARKIIDAKGLSLAPGFIDAHAHSEFTLIADHRAEGKVFQGITTEINGNCGLSAAPLSGGAREQREHDLHEMGIKERWVTFGEYFCLLEKVHPAINYATLVGHGNIRASVIGYADRKPAEGEMREMRLLLRKAISEGAIGLSTGLIYPPGVYSKTDEIIRLAADINQRIYATHMRSEGDTLIESIRETLTIGKESGIRVHISHIKTGGQANWGKVDEAISVMEQARREGVRLTCDRYPYTAASTDLDAVLPSWVYAGGAEEELRRLKDEKARYSIKGELLSQHPADDYWDCIAISCLQSESNKWMEGKTVLTLSKAAGKRPVDFLLDILVEERLRIGAIFYSMNEHNLVRFLSLPYTMIGSDSSARSMDGPTHKGKPHPRGFGTFPRFLGRYARDRRQMSIGKAIYKMTMLPAETFGLKRRGRILPDNIADLVIFDDQRLKDMATFEEPFLKPTGISYVLVNGSPVVWEGEATGKTAGKVLRHGE
ncbi:MAG TPA: D-aminoacylase [Thermodesulfovibrionales bacterium]|nr:D-aminoacylase [Thermodesulfovibrionales bacterium]